MIICVREDNKNDVLLYMYYYYFYVDKGIKDIFYYFIKF